MARPRKHQFVVVNPSVPTAVLVEDFTAAVNQIHPEADTEVLNTLELTSILPNGTVGSAKLEGQLIIRLTT